MERMKTFKFYYKSSDEKSRIIKGFVSIEIPDRDNEIVDLGSMDIEEFKDNPIILFRHDRHENLPLGKAIVVEKKEISGIKGLWMEIYISKASDWHNAIWTLITERILKSFSIGFGGVKDMKKEIINKKEYMRLFGSVLYETSIVDIPANIYSKIETVVKGYSKEKEKPETEEANGASEEFAILSIFYKHLFDMIKNKGEKNGKPE